MANDYIELRKPSLDIALRYCKNVVKDQNMLIIHEYGEYADLELKIWDGTKDLDFLEAMDHPNSVDIGIDYNGKFADYIACVSLDDDIATVLAEIFYNKNPRLVNLVRESKEE